MENKINSGKELEDAFKAKGLDGIFDLDGCEAFIKWIKDLFFEGSYKVDVENIAKYYEQLTLEEFKKKYESEYYDSFEDFLVVNDFYANGGFSPDDDGPDVEAEYQEEILDKFTEILDKEVIIPVKDKYDDTIGYILNK